MNLENPCALTKNGLLLLTSLFFLLGSPKIEQHCFAYLTGEHKVLNILNHNFGWFHVGFIGFHLRFGMYIMRIQQWVKLLRLLLQDLWMQMQVVLQHSCRCKSPWRICGGPYIRWTLRKGDPANTMLRSRCQTLHREVEPLKFRQFLHLHHYRRVKRTSCLRNKKQKKIFKMCCEWAMIKVWNFTLRLSDFRPVGTLQRRRYAIIGSWERY